MKEPDIVINGSVCTNAQSMTMRVAIGSFVMGLVNEGLGDDEVGKNIRDGYLKAANEIQHYMMKGE